MIRRIYCGCSEMRILLVRRWDVNGGFLQFPTVQTPAGGRFRPLAGNWTGTRTTVPGGIITIGVLGDALLAYISAGQLGLEDGFTAFSGDQFVSGTIAK